MTIRDLVRWLIGACGDVDDPVNVKIVKRDSENCMTEFVVIPISYLDAYDNICIEYQDIDWSKAKK